MLAAVLLCDSTTREKDPRACFVDFLLLTLDNLQRGLAERGLNRGQVGPMIPKNCAGHESFK